MAREGTAGPRPAAGQKGKVEARKKSVLGAWLEQHLQALVASLGRLYRAPSSSAMTAAVLAIALALPAAFLLFLANAEQITGTWEGGVRISLFLDRGLDASRYQTLANTLQQEPEVARVRLIGPEEGLEEFKQLSGFDAALSLLDENPLPAVIEVEPRSALDTVALETLAQRLRAHSEVDQVRLDRQWIERLRSIMALIERVVWVAAALLAAVVVLVIGNTIRLDIENRRDEIVIAKLIGATNAFIRRPFLYEGIWYGLIGGVAAAVLVELGRWLVSGPAHQLALLYGSAYSLSGLGGRGLLALLGVAVLLGLAGSYLAVGRHLKAIEPR